MSKPSDKLPTLDPNVRGIFARILEVVAQVRQERRSEEFMHAEKRREASLGALRELQAREAKASESEKLEAEMVAELIAQQWAEANRRDSP